VTVGMETRDGALLQKRVDSLYELWFSQRHAQELRFARDAPDRSFCPQLA